MTVPDTTTAGVPQVLGIPVPLPTGLDAAFHEGLARHELLMQRCVCGGWQWPPEVICHHCRRFDPGWAPVEPAGTIYAWTRVWHPAHEGLRAAVPYVVVVVELPGAGGARLVGNLLGDDPTVPVETGRAVTGVFVDHVVDGRPYSLLHWRCSD